MLRFFAVVISFTVCVQTVLAAEAAQPGNVKPVSAQGQINTTPPNATSATWIDSVTAMEFVPLPGGCFLMGDTWGDGQGDEKPVHKVCLSPFSMGKHEVTNAQYRKFRPNHNSGAYDGNSLNDERQPVANVSWNDAVEFAQWLSTKSGRIYRLPTEAEWEFAARGGTQERNYWGDNPSDSCVYANGADLSARNQWPDWAASNCNDGYKVASPVGSFLPNAYGLYDMMGNAWEWTSDWYDSEYYFNSPQDNPQGPKSGALKNPRGGGWGNASECIRGSDRNGFPTDFRILFLGFRLVATDR